MNIFSRLFGKKQTVKPEREKVQNQTSHGAHTSAVPTSPVKVSEKVAETAEKKELPAPTSSPAHTTTSVAQSAKILEMKAEFSRVSLFEMDAEFLKDGRVRMMFNMCRPAHGPFQVIDIRFKDGLELRDVPLEDEKWVTVPVECVRKPVENASVPVRERQRASAPMSAKQADRSVTFTAPLKIVPFEGDNILKMALTIADGSTDDIVRMLDELGDINQVYSPKNGHTVLHDLVLTGQVAKVNVALQRKPNLEIHSRNQKFTPLHTAAVNDHAAIIEALLDAGANIKATAQDGLTSLHLAAMRGHTKAISVLLRRGAELNETEINGATAMHGAAFYGYTDVVRLLLESGGDPERKDSGGLSPRMLAQKKGHAAILCLIDGASGGPKAS